MKKLPLDLDKVKSLLARFQKKKKEASGDEMSILPDKKAQGKPLVPMIAVGAIVVVIVTLIFANVSSLFNDSKSVPSFTSKTEKHSDLFSKNEKSKSNEQNSAVNPVHVSKETNSFTSDKKVPEKPLPLMQPEVKDNDKDKQTQIAKASQETVNKDQKDNKPEIQKPVSEYDPFKKEFYLKYKGMDVFAKLPSKQVVKKQLPKIPPPAPSPSIKQLKLSVYGVVIAQNDRYAISDRGIIREGNIIDSFVVEKIKQDMITVKNKTNKKDIRNIFISYSRNPKIQYFTPPAKR